MNPNLFCIDLKGDVQNGMNPKMIMKLLFSPLDTLASLLKKRHLRQSFKNPIITGCGRDALRYYENGRSVRVEAELMSGAGDCDRLIYRRWPLKWDDTAEPLTPDEQKHLFQRVCDHLDRKRVRWKFSDVGPSQ